MTKGVPGLVRALCMSADELATKKGEDNLLVQIKRNRERQDSCPGHDFEPVPDWRTRPGPFLWLKIRCRRCQGEMNAQYVMTYLRGVAHASGQDFEALSNAVFPPTATPK